MYIQEGEHGFNGFGDFDGSLIPNVKNFFKAASQPIKNLVKNPKSLLDPRNEWKTGRKMGQALEKVAVSANPLNPTLKKLGESGIKAGKKGNVVAKVLGRTSEKARKNPIATTAIVYAGVVAAGKAAGTKGASLLGSKAAGAGAGSMSAGATGASVGGATGTTVAGGTAGASGLVAAASKGVGAAGSLTKLVNAVTGKKEPDPEIDPFSADAMYAEMENPSGEKPPTLANMFTPQNLLVFSGLGALTIVGYLIFNKR